jgi:tRNA nucleotidyltransferase (CCA-adding enzyme)
METYIVGGWVRDGLLAQSGRAVFGKRDRDWVVVGASPESLLAQGYRPVGRDFPVFLHPNTQEEFALARTERKTAPGYRGFVVHASPEVTLEEDLIRRDLTINAIAMPASIEAPPHAPDPARLIDPYGGQTDLHARVLRHIGPAFAEDPVRLLRLARFAARFAEFRVADDTLTLAQTMVSSGEADALVPERVWQEIARGLMETAPSRQCQVLQDMGLLARLLPGLRWDDVAARLLDAGASAARPLATRFALLMWGMPDENALSDALASWRCDSDCADLARLAVQWRDAVDAARLASEYLRVLDRLDAWRRPARVEQLFNVFEHAWPQWPRQSWENALRAGRGINAGEIARSTAGGPAQIAASVAQARLQAVQQSLEAKA